MGFAEPPDRFARGPQVTLGPARLGSDSRESLLGFFVMAKVHKGIAHPSNPQEKSLPTARAIEAIR
jgi:hypothetical protein